MSFLHLILKYQHLVWRGSDSRDNAVILRAALYETKLSCSIILRLTALHLSNDVDCLAVNELSKTTLQYSIVVLMYCKYINIKSSVQTLAYLSLVSMFILAYAFLHYCSVYFCQHPSSWSQTPNSFGTSYLSINLLFTEHQVVNLS